MNLADSRAEVVWAARAGAGDRGGFAQKSEPSGYYVFFVLSFLFMILLIRLVILLILLLLVIIIITFFRAVWE